jgi:hypothetical protein
MIQVAAGHRDKMQEKEAELRAQGYKQVRSHHSKVGPMEYSKNVDYVGGRWSFILIWNDPDA